jgi:hypothetical protein
VHAAVPADAHPALQYASRPQFIVTCIANVVERFLQLGPNSGIRLIVTCCADVGAGGSARERE